MSAQFAQTFVCVRFLSFIVDSNLVAMFGGRI